MNRLDLPLFPIMLLLSILVHGAAFALWPHEWITPPELLPPQPGVASIMLVANDAARPQPTDKPADLPTDLPILDDPLNPPPLTDPKLARPTQQPMEPARPAGDSTPKLTADRKVVAPAVVPDLRAELLSTPIAPKENVKQPDPLKPISMPRPKTANAEPPKLETNTKVAEQVTKASQASLETDGVVDDLPQKLPTNPPPPYPTDAQALGQEGTVTLRLIIGAEGRVTAISIETSSGIQSLDNSALSTVRRWVFAPARRGGRAVPWEGTHDVIFSIKKR